MVLKTENRHVFRIQKFCVTDLSFQGKDEMIIIANNSHIGTLFPGWEAGLSLSRCNKNVLKFIFFIQIYI